MSNKKKPGKNAVLTRFPGSPVLMKAGLMIKAAFQKKD